MSPGDPRRRRRIALALTVLPILVLTLSPGPATEHERLSVWCVVCGWRGSSDALLNIALFVPFGVALGALGLPARRALLLGGAFSVGIELAQFLVPNRFPGLGDVIYNGVGSCLGVLLFTWRERLLEPPDRLGARRRTWTWGALGLLGLVSQAWLLGPAISEARPRVVFRPVTLWGAQYGGRIETLRVNGRDVPWGRHLPDGRVLDALAGGADLEVLLVAGPPAEGIMPLVRIDRGKDQEELFVIELDNDDILVRYRTNGMRLHLDRPLARWRRGAAVWAEGDTITLRVGAIGDGITVDYDGATGVSDFPVPPGPRSLQVPAARGWAFLMYPRAVARRTPAGLDFLWMLLIAIPLGVWGAPRAATVCAIAWIGTLRMLPSVSPLLLGSTPGSLGVVAGTLLGLLMRLVHANPEPFMWWKPLRTIYDPVPGEMDEVSPEPEGAAREPATTPEPATVAEPATAPERATAPEPPTGSAPTP